MRTFFIGENMNNHPLEQLITEYIAEKDNTKGSYDLYITVLKQYLSYLKEHDITYATKQDVINYIDIKTSQGYSNRWIYHQISAIKGLYHYLSLNQKRLDLPPEYEINMTLSIKNVKIHQQSPRKVLTTEQAKQLILKMKENRKAIWQYRDHAIIYLMLTTGLRGIEVRRAMRKNLKALNGKSVLYVQGKGRDSKDTYVKLTEDVLEAINDYLRRRKDKNPYLFITYSHRTKRQDVSRRFFNIMLKRILYEAGLEDVSITP